MGKFSEFKLPLKGMPVGIQDFEYHLGKQFFVDMESADIRGADLNVRLTVNHRNDCYDLAFAIDGEIVLMCDRCLDDMQFPVNAAYHIVVKYGEDYCDDSDDLLVIPESDNYLNVAYMVYDTVSLAIPIKHVHPQGQCNRAMSAMLKKHRARNVDDEDAGLEDGFADEMDSADDSGSAAATDPRWDELRKLSDNN
ncbi:MAG: DUF177 domain-containing protein [Muribaculaceae bacterium]|nr:DUF177 domain-containing protein [Muribaculaceae bacterium]